MADFSGGVTYQVNPAGADIPKFDLINDRLDFGEISVHGLILGSLVDGTAVIVNPWADPVQTQALQGLRWSDLSLDNFGVVGNEHLRQDIGGVLSWEKGIGERDPNTIYVRSHQFGVEDVVSGFDPQTQKLSFLYLGTRERMSVLDSDQGLLISFQPSGQSVLLLGVQRKDLIGSNLEFHHDQVMEDNLEVPFGFTADEVALVSREGLLTPASPMGTFTDGNQIRAGQPVNPDSMVVSIESSHDVHSHELHNHAVHSHSMGTDTVMPMAMDADPLAAGDNLLQLSSGGLKISATITGGWSGTTAGQIRVTNTSDVSLGTDWSIEFVMDAPFKTVSNFEVQSTLREDGRYAVKLMPKSWSAPLGAGSSQDSYYQASVEASMPQEVFDFGELAASSTVIGGSVLGESALVAENSTDVSNAKEVSRHDRSDDTDSEVTADFSDAIEPVDAREAVDLALESSVDSSIPKAATTEQFEVGRPNDESVEDNHDAHRADDIVSVNVAEPVNPDLAPDHAVESSGGLKISATITGGWSGTTAGQIRVTNTSDVSLGTDWSIEFVMDAPFKTVSNFEVQSTLREDGRYAVKLMPKSWSAPLGAGSSQDSYYQASVEASMPQEVFDFGELAASSTVIGGSVLGESALVAENSTDVSNAKEVSRHDRSDDTDSEVTADFSDAIEPVDAREAVDLALESSVDSSIPKAATTEQFEVGRPNDESVEDNHDAHRADDIVSVNVAEPVNPDLAPDHAVESSGGLKISATITGGWSGTTAGQIRVTNTSDVSLGTDWSIEFVMDAPFKTVSNFEVQSTLREDGRYAVKLMPKSWSAPLGAGSSQDSYYQASVEASMPQEVFDFGELAASSTVIGGSVLGESALVAENSTDVSNAKEVSRHDRSDDTDSEVTADFSDAIEPVDAREAVDLALESSVDVVEAGVVKLDYVAPEDLSDQRIVTYFEEWGVYDRDVNLSDVDGQAMTHLNYSFFDVKSDGSIELFDSYAAQEMRFGVEDQVSRTFTTAEYAVVDPSLIAAYNSDRYTIRETVDSVKVTSVPVGWNDVGLKDAGNFEQLRRFKELNPNVNLGFALGGWTLSGEFSTAYSTQAGRDHFTDEVVDLFRTHDFFNTVDFDWEYPGGGGQAGNAVRPDDGFNFALVLKQLRDKLNALTLDTGENYQVSIATAGGKEKLANLNLPGIDPYVDFYNVMTYDFHGGWENQTGHQAAMTGDDNNYDVDSAVAFFEDSGVELSKVVMGAPLYTRAWGGVDEGLTFGHNQPGVAGDAEGSFEAGVYDYKDIINDVITGQTDLYWDDTNKAAFTYDGDEWSSIETTATIAGKAAYIQEKDLGGMMFWALSNDADNDLSLLQAANDILRLGVAYENVIEKSPDFDYIIGGNNEFSLSDFTNLAQY